MSISEILKADIRLPRLKPGATWKGPRYWRALRWRSDLLTVTGQIRAIVGANAPLERGLEKVAIDAPNSKVETMLLLLRDDCAAGLTLADAMAKRPRFFPRFYVSLVRTGESTGRLHEALGLVSDDILDSIGITRSILQAAILLGLTLVVFAVLGTFIAAKVLPVFLELVADFGAPAPPLADAWYNYVQFLETRWPLAIAGVCSAVIAVKLILTALRRFDFASAPLAGALVYVPIIGGYIVNRNLAAICLMLRTLLKAGVPLDTALSDIHDETLHPVYRRAVGDAAKSVASGTRFSDCLEAYPRLFPESVRGLIAMGEDAGNLPEVLNRIGEERLGKTYAARQVAVDVAFPVCVIGMGALVLSVNGVLFETLITVVDALLYDMHG